MAAALARNPGGDTSVCSIMKGTIRPAVKCNSNNTPTVLPTSFAEDSRVRVVSIAVPPSQRIATAPQSNGFREQHGRYDESHPQDHAGKELAGVNTRHRFHHHAVSKSIPSRRVGKEA